MKRFNYLFFFFSIFLLSSCRLLRDWDQSLLESDPSETLPFELENVLISAIADSIDIESDCLLPCFANLYPGQSSLEDVANFAEQFTVVGSDVGVQQFETGTYSMLWFPESAGLLNVNLNMENDILSYISIRLSSVYHWLPDPSYDLPNVFQTFGSPDDVFVIIAGPPTRYSLVMPYNEQGIMFQYSATYDDRNVISDAPLLICLQPEVVDLDQLNIWLQSEDKVSLVEKHIPDLHDEREMRPWWDIQRMADITVDEFVEFFLTKPDACLPIASLNELRDQGYIP